MAIALCLLLASAVALGIASCSGSGTQALTGSCSINSDCNPPLACAFGRCHNACAKSGDCPLGERCAISGKNGVCQLPQESSCDSAPCNGGQVCGADKQCRVTCSPTQPCALGDYCVQTGATSACYSPSSPADETALIAAGILTADGSAVVDGSVVDASGFDGSLASDGAHDASPETSLDATAKCSNPPCSLGQPCGVSTECAPNLQCITGMCLQCMPGTTTCSGNKEIACQNGISVPPSADCASGCDPATGKCRVCPASTCSSMKVIFHGVIAGADGGSQDVELAVDVGATIRRTASASDPGVGHENLLFGNFIARPDGGVPSPAQYATDNNACGLADYGARTNVYYLAPMKGLPVQPDWYQPACTCGGQCGNPPCGDSATNACDFENQLTSISCPNFGNTCLMTPRKMQAIETVATGGDLTCKVCLYGSTTASAATAIKCLSPNTTFTMTDLYGAADAAPAAHPLLLRLDDGSSCASY